MNLKILYRVFGCGILILLTTTLTLYQFQHHGRSDIDAHYPLPAHPSPLNEAEFESGKLSRALMQAQEKELSSYRGDPAQDSFVEVPVERAMEVYLEKPSRREEGQ